MAMSATIPPSDLKINIPIKKFDGEKRLIYGIVLEPGTPDSVDAHGDWVSAATIELAAHKFLTKYQKASKLGVQHTMFGEIGLDLAESYIAPCNFELNGEKVKKGSWVLVTKVTDDVLWNKVKNGEYTGYSIGGVATVRAVAVEAVEAVEAG